MHSRGPLAVPLLPCSACDSACLCISTVGIHNVLLRGGELAPHGIVVVCILGLLQQQQAKAVLLLPCATMCQMLMLQHSDTQTSNSGFAANWHVMHVHWHAGYDGTVSDCQIVRLTAYHVKEHGFAPIEQLHQGVAVQFRDLRC